MNLGNESREHNDTGSQDEEHMPGHDEDDKLEVENKQEILNPLESALI